MLFLFLKELNLADCDCRCWQRKDAWMVLESEAVTNQNYSFHTSQFLYKGSGRFLLALSSTTVLRQPVREYLRHSAILKVVNPWLH